MKINKKYLFYLFRWQTSGIVIAPCIYLLNDNPLLATIVGNFLGAIIFWYVDKWIFRKKPVERGHND